MIYDGATMASSGRPEDEREAGRQRAEEDTAIYPSVDAGAELDPFDEGNAPPGTLVEAPAEPIAEVVPPEGEKPPVLRRKRRELERRRQRALLDLGGLVVEMSRRERMRVDLLAHRATVVRTLDSELDAVDLALAGPRTGTAAAPAGPTTCPRCGSSVPTGANYCASCGTSILTDESVTAQADGAREEPAGQP